MNRFLRVCGRVAGGTGLLFLLFAVAVVVIRCLPNLDENVLAAYVRNKGAYGVLVYVMATAIGSAVGVPRQGLSFVGGYAFGAFSGLVFATFGATLGCAASFFLVRHLGRPFLPRRFAARMRKLDAFTADAPFTMTLTVRCLPVGNNALTNVLAGMSTIPPFGFIAGSCVGYVPQNFIFSLLGSGMRVDPFWRVLVAALLFALALAIGAALLRRHRAQLAGDEKKY